MKARAGVQKRTTRVGWITALAVGMLVGLGGFTFMYGEGLSYFSSDPEACGNCHIMKDHVDAWRTSSHRNVGCNDCHVPHDLVGKYVTKAENGYRHSAAFTLEEVQTIRITESNHRKLQENCLRCHEPMLSPLLSNQEKLDCSRCHQEVGHRT